MKTILLILALACTALAQPPAPKPPVGVPADAKFFNGKWYRVYLEKVPWNRAVEKCRALGGQLVTVPDAPTWAFVRGLCGDASLWLGATDEKAEGVWTWVDGANVGFTAWRSAQPDNSRAVENYLSTYKGEWNDTPRNGEFMANQFVVGFICEWPRSK